MRGGSLLVATSLAICSGSPSPGDLADGRGVSPSIFIRLGRRSTPPSRGGSRLSLARVSRVPRIVDVLVRELVSSYVELGGSPNARPFLLSRVGVQPR